MKKICKTNSKSLCNGTEAPFLYILLFSESSFLGLFFTTRFNKRKLIKFYI